ncbi:hypothetical protein Tco_0304011 [Tanacetum coccineum]
MSVFMQYIRLLEIRLTGWSLLKINLISIDWSCLISWQANVLVLLRNSKKDTFCLMLGVTESVGVFIQVPRQSKNKGTGSHSRFKNMDELIQNEAEPSKKRRTCFVCGKAEGHNSRTCAYKDIINAPNKRTIRSTHSLNVNYKE